MALAAEAGHVVCLVTLQRLILTRGMGRELCKELGDGHTQAAPHTRGPPRQCASAQGSGSTSASLSSQETKAMSPSGFSTAAASRPGPCS